MYNFVYFTCFKQCSILNILECNMHVVECPSTDCVFGYRHPDQDTLIPDLEELWQKFLCSIESSVSDYLSVEHLGIIIKRLAETGK